jgi:hypothetical protein
MNSECSAVAVGWCVIKITLAALAGRAKAPVPTRVNPLD